MQAGYRIRELELQMAHSFVFYPSCIDTEREVLHLFQPPQG